MDYADDPVVEALVAAAVWVNENVPEKLEQFRAEIVREYCEGDTDLWNGACRAIAEFAARTSSHRDAERFLSVSVEDDYDRTARLMGQEWPRSLVDGEVPDA